MTTDYPPGTVAVATVRGVQDVRMFLQDDGEWTTATRVKSYFYHPSGRVTDIRPLVVLDMDDCPVSYVAALEALRSEETFTGDWLADQIEAQVKPTRIEEPAPYTVIKDARGTLWVRLSTESYHLIGGTRVTQWHLIVNPQIASKVSR